VGCNLSQQGVNLLLRRTHVYAIDSMVLKPPSMTNLMSRAVKPFTPCMYVSRRRYASSVARVPQVLTPGLARQELPSCSRHIALLRHSCCDWKVRKVVCSVRMNVGTGTVTDGEVAEATGSTRRVWLLDRL
jgi:hypothetical protein